MAFRTKDDSNNPDILVLIVLSLFQLPPLLFQLLPLLPLLSLLPPVSQVANTKIDSDFSDTPLHMRVLSCRRNHPD
ncbi:hypothetical protein AR158_c054R [Paramecium bursaria Chlorella virus AR158]|uniref:hypothetical protein n=1 Tax=Paramecium bursaria Chlorella virus AR158 TaxID=380598 RepID=UPI00015AA76D|nr:hypothetical protein AR158_c054R [Paramecium bursaria Chlorella virus AR158]ABU43600.1 hypothetical protein AR158_c054R [Paramecium bursaria Chlorella virus AR158]